MSLFDRITKSRRRESARSYVPSADWLEDRQTPSVAAPTGLSLTALSSTQVKLTWNDAAGEQGFHIEQWNGSQTVQIGTVGEHVTTFTATGLTPNTVQYFAVQSFDSTTTAQSAWASITTPALAITAPSNVTVSNITLSSATLTWTAGTGQTGYNIFQWNGSTAVQIGSVGASVTSYKLTNLTAGSVNYFYVEGFNGSSYASSPWVTVQTLAPQLTAPGNFQASALNSSTVQLAWTNSPNAAGYKIYEWNGVQGVAPVVITTLAANTTGYQPTNLFSGTTYWFYVQAYDGNATANSPWVSVSTQAVTPLKAPTNVTATETTLGTVQINWTEPTGAAGYNVYMWMGYYWALVSNVLAGTHEATVTGLAPNQTVWFMVQAYSANDVQVADSAPAFANI